MRRTDVNIFHSFAEPFLEKDFFPMRIRKAFVIRISWGLIITTCYVIKLTPADFLFHIDWRTYFRQHGRFPLLICRFRNTLRSSRNVVIGLISSALTLSWLCQLVSRALWEMTFALSDFSLCFTFRGAFRASRIEKVFTSTVYKLMRKIIAQNVASTLHPQLMPRFMHARCASISMKLCAETWCGCMTMDLICVCA